MQDMKIFRRMNNVVPLLQILGVAKYLEILITYVYKIKFVFIV